MKITQVISHRSVGTRRALVSHAVKLEEVLNGGPLEKELDPILQRIGQVLDLNGTTAAQVAKLLQTSDEAILTDKGGLRVRFRPSAPALSVVISFAGERPNRLPTWSPELQQEAAKLCSQIADVLR